MVANCPARIDVDDLKHRVDLVRLIEQSGVSLRRSGRSYKGLCPFHDENTPSFHVFGDHYHCFGCGAHGDAITFTQMRHGIDFKEAATILGGTPATNENGTRRRIMPRNAAAPHPFEAEAAYVWHRAVVGAQLRDDAETRPAFEYMNSRRLIGGRGRSWGVLTEPCPPLLRSWLRTGHVVIAPLHDVRTGLVVSVQARSIHADAAPKTLNPRGVCTAGLVFCNTWGRVLLQRNWPPPKPRVVVVAEGLTDHCALSIAVPKLAVLGVPGTSAAVGIIGPWAKAATVVLAFDCDEAGRAASALCRKAAWHHGAGRVLRVRWPRGAADASDALTRLGGAAALGRWIEEGMSCRTH